MCISTSPGKVSHSLNPQRWPVSINAGAYGGVFTFIKKDEDNHITTTERSVTIPRICRRLDGESGAMLLQALQQSCREEIVLFQRRRRLTSVVHLSNCRVELPNWDAL